MKRISLLSAGPPRVKIVIIYREASSAYVRDFVYGAQI